MSNLEYPVIDISIYKRPALSRAASPFRYPGGKGFLSGYLANEVKERFSSKPTFVEPFCGGAGAALHLLQNQIVSRVILNDADIRVYSAWRAMLHDSERFIEELKSVPVNIATWNEMLEKVYSAQPDVYSFELGFATLFINRTSRSGVIIGSGPIGGYNQSGKWKIDARFNRVALVEKVKNLARMRDRVLLFNRDGLDFCRNLSSFADSGDTFLFIDPPYIEAGGRLYLDAMSEANHVLLADWINSGIFPHWILTYDRHPLVLELYHKHQPFHLSVNYSLAKKRIEKELVYAGSW